MFLREARHERLADFDLVSMSGNWRGTVLETAAGIATVVDMVVLGAAMGVIRVVEVVTGKQRS